MSPISVNELTESVNSNLPRDIKSTIAKNILAEEKDSDVAKNIFSEIISDLSSKTQNIKIQIKNKKYKELIIGTIVGKNNIVLDPFQTVWLSN